MQVKLEEIVSAFDWVDAGAFENSAYVNRESGVIYWASSVDEPHEELPENLEDETLYLPVPHKNELELGRDLALSFVEERLPDSYELVREYFRKKGAYGKFKALLERRGCIEGWYQYEEEKVKRALCEWGRENGLEIIP